MIHLADIRREFRPMLRLAAPLALAELGWMAMGIVDTMMAGPLGPAAVGAGILGNMVFYPLAASFIGLLLGMDTLVAQSFGARDPRDCRRTLVAGIWLSIALTPISVALTMGSIPLIRAAGANPKVMAECVPYMENLAWGLLPLYVFSALRRYLRAVNVVKPVTFVLVSANIVNFVGDWALMYGRLGAPAMGLPRSGWSTSISRVYMAIVMAAAVVWEERKSERAAFGVSWRPDRTRIRAALIALGLPATGLSNPGSRLFLHSDFRCFGVSS